MLNSHRRTVRAFTLIELLVVVAIIALLVAILLPSLQKARKQARSVVCLTQMHALALGAFTYATEFGRYPPSLSNYTSCGAGSTNFGGIDWLGVGDQFGTHGARMSAAAHRAVCADVLLGGHRIVATARSSALCLRPKAALGSPAESAPQNSQKLVQETVSFSAAVRYTTGAGPNFILSDPAWDRLS